MPSRGWRLLLDAAAPGPWNMGVDEALWASACGGGAPALRLYRWHGSWLSLGYAQCADTELLRRCEAVGVGVVRRSTGGRAVLHGADLSYAVAAPEVLLPRGLAACYARIAETLVAALRTLGVEATRRATTPAAGAPGFDCFAAAAGDEILAQDRKLAGSAQRRGGGGVLQHGSLRLAADPAAAAAAAGLQPGAAISLAEVGLRVGLHEVEDALTHAFCAAFGARFEPSCLSASERAAAERRVQAHATAPLGAPPRPGPIPSREPRAGR